MPSATNRHSSLAFFNLQASSATLILQVELVQPVELVLPIDARTRGVD
jgi:hypothetical protein